MGLLVLWKDLYKSKVVPPYTGFKLPEKSTGETMGKYTWLKSAAIAFLLIIIILPMLWQGNCAKADLFAPTWLKKGAYAEYQYKGPTIGLTFLNSTEMTNFNVDSLIYRWECTEVNDTVAQLEVSLDSTGENMSLHLSTDVYVNTVSRSVFLSNGTSVGTTRLWLPANPSEGQEIILWHLSPDEIIGSAETSFNGNPTFMNTPQGYHRVFLISGNGTINNQQIFFFPSTCDFDTGVVVNGIFSYEATVIALGIKEILGGAELTATNIDLGPRESSIDIRAALPYATLIAAIVIVAITIFMRRRRKLKSEGSKIKS